jgi:hypothetical protein
VTFAAGAGAAGLLAVYRLARLGLVNRRYRKAVDGLEAEVHQLRNLPLVADATADPAREGAAAAARGALERGT